MFRWKICWIFELPVSRSGEQRANHIELAGTVWHSVPRLHTGTLQASLRLGTSWDFGDKAVLIETNIGYNRKAVALVEK